MHSTDVPATPEKTTPSPERFGLNRPGARIWLNRAVAVYMAAINGEEPPAALEPEADIWELPEIDRSWNPRDPDEQAEVFRLVSSAVEAGIIRTPPDTDLDFEPLPSNDGDDYQFQVYVGRYRLTLTSHTEAISRLGEPGATGVAAALAVLEEAVRSANGVLDDLDTYISSRGSDPAQHSSP